MCIYEIAHNRAFRPCHPSHSMPLALILPRWDHWYLLRKPLIRRDRGDTLSLLVQFLLELCVCVCICVCLCVCVSVCIYQIAHNRAIRPCNSSHSRPLALCVCVCVFIKLHITAQSGPVILVILGHSHCACVCIYYIAYNRAIRPCHPSHSMPLAWILPRGDQ